jgi:hypothetical protein
MRGSGQRLATAITARGFESIADFARSVGKKEVTVRQQINRDNVPEGDAPAYIRKLKIPLKWLLYGGPSPFGNREGVEQAETDSAVDESLGTAPADSSQGEPDEKEGDLVKGITFYYIVGDLQRRIGHLEEQIAQLQSTMETRAARPRKGREPS